MTQDIHSGPGDLAPGEQLAGYEIQERIGRGGMAVVYRALDLRLGRLVALKVLAPHLGEDEAFRQRFMRESRAAAGVDHPHIVPVFEAGEAAGVLFIAMRYVSHGDVRSLIESEVTLSPARTARIASQVASALDAAHTHGLVHRDVKPANILLGQASGSDIDHVYLSDFGLSKHSLTPSTLTSTGQFLGTLDYVSPEQIQGQPVDGRADQYALACAVVEMLTGAPPFRRDDSMALMWAQLEAAPPRLTERRPELPAAVDDVIAAAMSKSPAGRFASCREFADALAAACERQAPHRPGPATARAQPIAADTYPTDEFPADRFPAEPRAADRFPAPDWLPSEPRAADMFPAEPSPAGQYAADRLPADPGPAGPYAADRLPAEPHPAEPYPAEHFPAATFSADANVSDRLTAGGLSADPSSRQAADPWPDPPGAWFRSRGRDSLPAAEQTVGPGWRAGSRGADGPVPGPIAPYRPSVDAAWDAATPLTKRDDAQPPTRPTQPRRAGGGPAHPHRARNVVLGLLITVIGLCGVAGIAYKLSQRRDRTLPPVTVTKTVPPGGVNPALTVREYFAAINHHKFMLAWRLSGEREPYATFRAGFVGTAHDTATIESVNGNVVSVRLLALQANGTVKTYEGKYTVTNGVISATDVKRVS